MVTSHFPHFLLMAQPPDLQLIDQIYESVQTPDLLMPAYKAMAEQCGGFAAHYLKIDLQRQSVLDTQISDAALYAGQSAYADYYVSVDSRLPWYSTGGVGEWRADQHIFDEHYVRHSEIYNDFLKPAGAKRAVTCQLRRTPNEFATLAIVRPHDAGDFQDAELQRLQLFTTHLVRATELRTRLDQATLALHSAQGALRYLPYGTAWLNAQGRIVWLSPSAESQLTTADGLHIHASRLRCTDPQLDRQLQAALARATGSQGREGRCLNIPRRYQPTPWMLSIIPGTLPSSCGGGDTPHALAIIQDGSGPALPHPRQLRQLYGLTAAEVRLAIGLLHNDTLAEYAARHHLGLPTVRTHLRNLFTKTGTRRQSELLRRLSLPLAMPGISTSAG